MRVRVPEFSDIATVSDIMVRSFRSAFSDFVSPETMAACTNEENCRRMLEDLYSGGTMHFLMSDEGGMLVWQDTEAGPEIVALHTLPCTRGTGLGQALMAQALADIGPRPVFLWAFEENSRARRFYEKLGFSHNGQARVSEFDGAMEVRYIKCPSP